MAVSPIRFVCEVPGVVEPRRAWSRLPRALDPLSRGSASSASRLVEAGSGVGESRALEAPARPAARRALVAEDDREMRQLLARWLRREGFEVFEAADGRSAIVQIGLAQLWREQPAFDLVVTDVRMPGFSGLDVLEAIRGLGLRTPVILITGFDDPAARAAAGRSGVVAVLPKPFDSARLRGAVERARGLPEAAWRGIS